MNQLYQVTIKGVLVNPKTKKALVLLRNNGEIEFWDLPGGRTEPGELIEETLKRELKEELLNLKEYVIDKIFYSFKIEHAQLILICYRIELDLEKVELSDEHKGYRWISFEEIDLLEKEAFINLGTKQALKLGLTV